MGRLNAVSPDIYADPPMPAELRCVRVPVVRATDETLRGYGRLVDDAHGFPIEIVTWPLAGWRAMDPGTGNEGGTTVGEFDFWWQGDALLGKNHAVGSSDYVFGWSCDPQVARRDRQTVERERVLLWHANYHPDGGQLFFPMNGESFLAPLALPGDDVKPQDFVSFRVEGGKGLYNPADHLWWRDQDFDAPYAEPNGANCYWSRGTVCTSRFAAFGSRDQPKRYSFCATAWFLP